jgi:hypothetical protein
MEAMAHLVRCFPPLKTGFSVAMFSTQGFHQEKNYSDFLLGGSSHLVNGL